LSTPIHNAFGLTYSSYLVMPRSLLQEMPEEWQRRFVDLCEEFEAKFPAYMGNRYTVQLRDPSTSTESYLDECDEWVEPEPVHIPDPLADYRHPNQEAIEEQQGNDDANSDLHSRDS
jgi:hypothetical protein